MCEKNGCLFSQGSLGPPGREGLSGPRGEPVSHFQSLARLSDANRRQAQHSVKQTNRYGQQVELKSFLFQPYFLTFFSFSFCIPGQAG